MPVVERAVLVASMKPEHRAWLDRFSLDSVLAVPLRARGIVTGLITASRHGPGRSYNDADRRLLEALADRAALVIENATLIEELRQTVHVNELFAGVLGHDLRSPLGSILTAA